MFDFEVMYFQLVAYLKKILVLEKHYFKLYFGAKKSNLL